MYAQQIYVHLTVVGNIPFLQHFLISSNGFLQTCSTVRWENSCFSMQNLITPLTEDKGRMKRVQHVRDRTHPPDRDDHWSGGFKSAVGRTQRPHLALISSGLNEGHS